MERYACTADLSKGFFQVAMPECHRNLFRLLWYKNYDLDKGKVQLYRFTRHVWGINSGLFIELFASGRLIAKNPKNACTIALMAVENNWFMDELLLAFDLLSDLKKIPCELSSLFESRGFKLRKWQF